MNPEKEREFFNYLKTLDRAILYEDIYIYMKTCHAGKDKAIRLKKLYQIYSFLDVKDHEDMRQICSEILPLCSCSKGVYYPVTKEDIEIFVNWMKPRVFAIFERIKRIKEMHKEIYPNGHQFQLWEKFE